MKIRNSAAIIASIALILNHADAANALTTKKVIEWGWDEPDTAFIRNNIANMEKMPFQGVVFHVQSNANESLVWNMWSPTAYKLSQFSNAASDLVNTHYTRFTDRFLRVNVTPGNVDWFDNTSWQSVLGNFKIAARLAKEGRCKGFMFDTEQYNNHLFDYRAQANASTKSFQDYATMVRQRGKEWITAINSVFPNITIMWTWGYNQSGSQSSGRDTNPYGLLASLLDGIIDGATKTTSIVDGGEYAYEFTSLDNFQYWYNATKNVRSSYSADPSKYKQLGTAAFGLWMDANWQTDGWNLTNFSTNVFTPSQWQTSMQDARATTDKYIWIYSENPNWWTGNKLPQAYVDATRNAQ